MYRLLPKHKGTEKLQSDLKQKISRLKDDLEAAKGSGKKAGVSYRVPHEGAAGQIALVGSPNSGKSALLASLTHAHPEVAAYPFTTRSPQPGIMMWQDVPVQLVDLPPISPEFLEPWVPNIIRAADAALLVADMGTDDMVEEIDAVLERLAATHTELVGALPYDVDDEAVRHVKTLIVATKMDVDGAGARLELIRDWLETRFPILSVSVQARLGLETLREAAYHLLGVLRVYTKVPGKPVDRSRPFTLPIGSSVLDLARDVHKEFEDSLKFARIWGQGVFDGQTVKRDHELHDSDVVELHVS